jgi:hypothetical protein
VSKIAAAIELAVAIEAAVGIGGRYAAECDRQGRTNEK